MFKYWIETADDIYIKIWFNVGSRKPQTKHVWYSSQNLNIKK